MMCIISKQRIAFRTQVEGTQGEIFAVSPIAFQSCITSKERIAFGAQVEVTRGEIFAASPITLQSRCNRIPNEPIATYGQSWSQCQSDRLNRRPTEQEEMVKQWLEGDMEHDALNWWSARHTPPLGCLWRLWRSASTPTEPSRLDGNVFC